MLRFLQVLSASTVLAFGLRGPALAMDASIAPMPHTVTIQGSTVRYKTSFDTYTVAGGTVTTITYERRGGDARRPVLFAFSGGPGAASIFLNVGVLGPERIDIPADVGAKAPAQYPLQPNGDSPLDVADVVMIDPAGTGFSRITDPSAKDALLSTDGDAAAVAGAIQSWSRVHGRLASPKYLLGESYGSVRAVEVATDMIEQTDEGGSLKGILVLSQSLTIVDTVQRRGNIVAQIVILPAIASAAWFHKLAGQGETLQVFVDQAKAFGYRQWLPALFAGSTLDASARKEVANGLATITGLHPQYFLDHNLYLSGDDYCRMALASQGLTLGKYDTRYTGTIGAGANDPSGVLEAAMIAVVPDFFRRQLGVKDTSGYHAMGALGNWTYVRQPFGPHYINEWPQIDYVAHLKKLMDNRKDLRLFVGGGWFDMAANTGADDYLLSRDGLDLRRITSRHYIGGHMFYSNPDSRRLFAADLRTFVGEAR